MANDPRFGLSMRQIPGTHMQMKQTLRMTPLLTGEVDVSRQELRDRFKICCAPLGQDGVAISDEDVGAESSEKKLGE